MYWQHPRLLLDVYFSAFHHLFQIINPSVSSTTQGHGGARSLFPRNCGHLGGTTPKMACQPNKSPTHSHTGGTHVFGLGKKPWRTGRTCKLHSCMEETLEEWGNSANHQVTVPPHITSVLLRLHRITIDRKETKNSSGCISCSNLNEEPTKLTEHDELSPM